MTFLKAEEKLKNRESKKEGDLHMKNISKTKICPLLLIYETSKDVSGTFLVPFHRSIGKPSSKLSVWPVMSLLRLCLVTKYSTSLLFLLCDIYSSYPSF